MRSFAVGWIVGLCFVASCHAAPSAGPAAVSSHAKSPLSMRELRTTDPVIALGNLSGEIEVLEHALAGNRLRPHRLGELVTLLLARGQAVTSIADYERAGVVAEQFVRDQPDDPDSFLARARVRSTFHRFDDALADLNEAARLRGHGSQIDAARASILQALGRYDEALEIRRRAATIYPNILTLGAEASVLAERGDIEEAERAFVAAQDAYRDVSPLPLCWLYFQQGMMWLRAGNLSRAQELFEAAHERLPQNAAVSDHLGWLVAASGDRDRAVALLHTAAETSDDPAAAADLARVLQYAGRSEESERWRSAAAARYDELLQRYPEGFANHAALFWLGAGADPHRALALALQLVEQQKTPSTYALMLQSALASGDSNLACLAATRTLAFGAPTAYDSALSERSIAARVAQTCGQVQFANATGSGPLQN